MLCLSSSSPLLAPPCKDIRPSVAPHTLAISLIKGFHHDEKKKQFKLVTDLVTENLGVPCACLMGANLAGEISRWGENNG